MFKKILMSAFLIINIYASEQHELQEGFDTFNTTFESILICHQQCHNCTNTMAAFSLANYWLRDACLNGNASHIVPLQVIPNVKNFLLSYVEHYGARLTQDMLDEKSLAFVQQALAESRAFLANPVTAAEIIWGEDNDSDFAALEAITPQMPLEDYTGDKLLLGAPTSDLTNADWYTVDIIQGNQNLIADLRRQETYDYITQKRPQRFARELDERCYKTVSETIRRNAAALTAPGGIFCAFLNGSWEQVHVVAATLMESGFSRVLLGSHCEYYCKHMSVEDLISAFESSPIDLNYFSLFSCCSILAIKNA